MTEKTNTGDLVLDRNGYFHVVYLISDEEKLYGMSNYYIGHIDNCTLVLTDEKLQELRKPKDRQPTFAVGEYYSFTTYRKDYDADTTFIFKTLETKNSGIRVIEYDFHGKELGEYVYDIDSDFLKESKTATAEQIATFKRAEHFASKGRKLDEFRVGDRVMDERGKVFTVTHITNGYLFYNTEIIDSVMKAKLIKIMEDKNEI